MSSQNRKRVGGILILLFLAGMGFSQRYPYKVRLKKDIPAMGYLGGMSLGVLLYQKNIEGMSPSWIASLDTDKIPRIDRSAIHNFNHGAEFGSDLGLYASFASLSTLVFIPKVRSHVFGVSIMAAEAFLLNYSLTNLSKSLILRPRPFVYNADVPLSQKTQRDARFSFFSGHSSTAACLSFFTAKVIQDCNPESPIRFFGWAGAVLITGTTGWLRIKAGKHFPTDVLSGWVVGGATGILIPVLHKRKKDNLRIFPSPGGMTFSMIF